MDPHSSVSTSRQTDDAGRSPCVSLCGSFSRCHRETARCVLDLLRTNGSSLEGPGGGGARIPRGPPNSVLDASCRCSPGAPKGWRNPSVRAPWLTKRLGLERPDTHSEAERLRSDEVAVWLE